MPLQDILFPKDPQKVLYLQMILESTFLFLEDFWKIIYP